MNRRVKAGGRTSGAGIVPLANMLAMMQGRCSRGMDGYHRKRALARQRTGLHVRRPQQVARLCRGACERLRDGSRRQRCRHRTDGAGVAVSDEYGRAARRRCEIDACQPGLQRCQPLRDMSCYKNGGARIIRISYPGSELADMFSFKYQRIAGT